MGVVWKWVSFLFFFLACCLSFRLSFLLISCSYSSVVFLSLCILSPTEYDSAPHSTYLLMERGRVNECDRAVMYVPAKASEGQCRDRRCHILTSLSVSATSWTFLLSHFLSHSISILSFLSGASLPLLCCVSTITYTHNLASVWSQYLFLHSLLPL